MVCIAEFVIDTEPLKLAAAEDDTTADMETDTLGEDDSEPTALTDGSPDGDPVGVQDSVADPVAEPIADTEVAAETLAETLAECVAHADKEPTDVSE